MPCLLDSHWRSGGGATHDVTWLQAQPEYANTHTLTFPLQTLHLHHAPEKKSTFELWYLFQTQTLAY